MASELHGDLLPVRKHLWQIRYELPYLPGEASFPLPVEQGGDA